MTHGIPSALEQRRPILLVYDASNHLINRMHAGTIDPRDARDAILLLCRVWNL